MLLINDIRRQNHAIAGDIQTAIARVFERAWYILGPEVEAFEREFADYCGVEHCAGVGNGTDALELALRALDLPAGSRVMTVANAGGYSSTAILAAGHIPVYADVDPVTMTMRPVPASDVQAIVVTHLYGRMAAMPEILAAAGSVPVIEDCAQAHGAVLDGRKAGAWGTLGCFSFYPTKNLGALGDGGAIITRDASLGARLRLLRQYGWTSKYKSDVPGGRNSRLDELQAAILRVKLPYLDRWNLRRREIAGIYNDAFRNLPLHTAPLDDSCVAHLYVVRPPDRARMRAVLTAAGYATDIHYPVPDYAQNSMPSATPLPVTEECCRTVLTLPCFPELTDDEIRGIVQAVRLA